MLIKESEMPAPRLEFRWSRDGETWDKRKCDYNLVLPLGKHDIRAEGENGERVRDSLTVHMGTTRVEGGSSPISTFRGEIDTPFRDGAHAEWDSRALGGLPIYAVADGFAMKVS